MKNIDAYKIYNTSLAIMLFTLPVTEGIKQISLFLTILAGCYIVFKDKKRVELDLINIGIIAFISFTIISCIVNQSPAKSIMDPLRCALFFIVARAVGAEKLNLKFLFYALSAGFIVAFVMGCVTKFSSTDPSELFQLKSIGHVNHSSIFMLLVFSISVALINQKNNILKYLAIFISIVSVVGVIITGSRATMYLLPVVFAITLAYFALSKQTNIKTTFLFLGIFVLVAIFTSYIVPDERIHQKIAMGITSNETRMPIFYSAIYTWQEHPFFGIGSENFKIIDITQYFPGNYEVNRSHAHNTFLTFLTEKGIFALIGYLIFQISLFFKLIKHIRVSILAFMAISVLAINNIISIANTTFHHENALLMLCVWALAIGIVDKINEKNSISKS
ncbi:O-antigen ligase family protein [Campylobacter sp.]|uniref:O-antigen ligase family protein n=1 Tax=Campylobacter sp. TaxID=205 RepID=UPI002709A1F2|nr:O-antigen ligase family protein [Campylobacter sp.]